MDRKLVWTRHNVWGSVGMSHQATITIGSVTWVFVIDQPKKGQWQGRGWANDRFAYYRPEARTAESARATAQRFVDELKDDGKVAL